MSEPRFEDVPRAWHSDYWRGRAVRAESHASELRAEARALQARERELREAVLGAAKLVDAIGQWFIEAEPEVPKWFEDAVLEIERTTRAALSTPEAEREAGAA